MTQYNRQVVLPLEKKEKKVLPFTPGQAKYSFKERYIKYKRELELNGFARTVKGTQKIKVLSFKEKKFRKDYVAEYEFIHNPSKRNAVIENCQKYEQAISEGALLINGKYRYFNKKRAERFLAMSNDAGVYSSRVKYVDDMPATIFPY